MTRPAPPVPAQGHRISAGATADPTAGPTADPTAAAAAFAAQFRVLYLTYHRRDGPRSGLTGASRAVLGHLAHTGPLTIGEAALHLDRAQSVVSEIVDESALVLQIDAAAQQGGDPQVGWLERRGLLVRDCDPADRRRTLVRLAPAGVEALRRDAEVLSEKSLTAAMARMPEADRRALLTRAAALLAAAPPPTRPRSHAEERR